MTMLAFTSAYSQCLAMFPSKHVMLFAVTAFEFGSGVCGAAPNMIALVLGLQWGGVTKSWNHWSVVVCFLMSDALAVIFVAWEAFMGNNAMLPLKLFQSRTVRGAGILSMFGWASFIIAVYYFSLGFQAVYKWVFFLRPKIHAEFRFRSMSALEAGMHILPLIMVAMLAVSLAGRLIFHVNLYFVILLGPVFITAGYGLLY